MFSNFALLRISSLSSVQPTKKSTLNIEYTKHCLISFESLRLLFFFSRDSLSIEERHLARGLVQQDSSLNSGGEFVLIN